MSKGSAGSSARVSIPSTVRKTIGNIKEITGQNHSEDEIYAMLKECSMDPNETAQKLLLLDTFHEVRRKKDKRKENMKEPAESKGKPGTQGRANRAGRGSYLPRRISRDAGSGSTLVASKENAISPPEKTINKPSLATTQELKRNATFTKLEEKLHLKSSVDSTTKRSAFGTEAMQQHKVLNESQSTSIPSVPAPGSYFSSSDPVLLPSQDLPIHGVVGPIKRGVGADRTPVIPIADNPTEKKLLSSKNSAIEVERSNLQPTPVKDFHGVENDQHLEGLQPGSSTIDISTASSRPASNQSNSSQNVGPSKEWKPKSTNISVGQHVIIPDHLHVPEVEKLGFCFGSFDSSFGDSNHDVILGSDKGPLSSQSSEIIHEHVEEQQLSNQYDSATVEDTETKYSDQPQSALQEPENVTSNEVKVSSAAPDSSESNHGAASGALQHPAVHTSSNYNTSFMPTTLPGQPSPLASSESQARDAPRHPNLMVPQSMDPASFYTQYYRTSLENDGRISPFLSSGAANKYNGGPPHISQSVQEGGVPLLFTTGSPSPMVTQAAGVMQTSLPTQQPFPLFRQPTGVPLTHYPPNIIPYGPYFSPLYIPSPPLHQFLSNGPFPQQPPAGNIYPTPTGTTAKYPSSNEDLPAQVKEKNLYVNGQQTDGTGVWFTTPNRDISTLQASFYNLPPGQLAFNPPQPGHGTFTGMFHPPQAAAPPVHPLYQQSQVITTPSDMVGATPSVYQQQQHPQLNWQSNY